MIFQTFDKIDKDGSESQGWGFFTKARLEQQVYERNKFEDSLKKQKEQIEKFNKTYDNAIKSDKKITHEQAFARAEQSIADADNEVKKYCKSTDAATRSAEDFGKKQTAAFNKSQKAFSGFSLSMKTTLASLGAEMVAALAIQLAIKGFQKLDEELGLTAGTRLQKMETAVNDYNDALSESKENISTIKSLSDEFKTLSKGVNNAGENVSLSADEYTRYNEIVDELVAINPELVKGYTNEGKAIVDRNAVLEEAIALQEEYADIATASYIASGDDILRSVRDSVDEAYANLEDKAVEVAEILGTNTGTHDYHNAKDDGLAYSSLNNDIINSVLEKEIDLEHASAEELQEIAAHKEEILAKTIETNKWERGNAEDLKKINELSSKLTELGISSTELEQAYAPMTEYLTTYVTEMDSLGEVAENTSETILSSVPDVLQSGYLSSLKTIASHTELTTAEMKTQATLLADSLNDLYYGDNRGVRKNNQVKIDGEFVTYKETVEAAEEAKKEFDESVRDSGAVEDYNEAIEDEVEALELLADKWESIDPLVAESLRSQANSIRDYATDNIMTLTEALNPLADKFDEARGAKERFDAAMEASGDYNTAIDSFKEIYDEIMTSENTAGNGSIALNTGAVQILGQDRVFELGSSVKVEKELKNIKPILEGGEAGARAFFKRLYDCRDALNKVTDDAVKFDEATGKVSFDFDEDKWDEYARAMGFSVELLSAAVNNARQYADIDLGNLETIKSSIMDMDGSIIKKNGKEVYQSLQNFRTAALAAGYGFEEINNRVEDLKSEGVHLIDLTSDATTLAESLAGLGSNYGLAQDSNKDGIYEIDAEKTITQMFAWGEGVDFVRSKITELLEAAEDGDVELNFEKPNDVSWEDWIEDLKVQFDTQFGESEDPFTKMASSADAFTAAVNDLIIALGHLPDNYEIGTNFDEIVDDINNLATNKNLSGDQKDNLTNNITVGIEDAKAEIEKYKQLLNSGDLTEAQEQELKLNIEDAEAKVEQFEAILQDLQDGKLDNFTFNIETGEFIENSQVPEMTVKPVIEGSPEIEPVETPIVPKLEQPSLDKLEENGVKIDADVQLTNENEIQQKLDELNAPPIVRDIILGEQELPPNTVPFATQDIHLGEVETPETKFTGILDLNIRPILSGLSQKVKEFLGYAAKGTPQSPNYRSHSSFPSMAKGGRLGPRGNGGLTLTGELGTELVWIPSESRSFLVGQYGPEMVNLPGDAVVYPAEETRKIIGDTIHPSRLRFGTGSMAKGSMQFGSMGDANGSMSIYGTGGITNGKDKTKKKVKTSVDAYEKGVARLDHLLEMGYINEKTYFERLKKLYNAHKSALKKDVEANREALEKKRQARIDAYEHEKEDLEYKLDRGKITEAKYYTELEKLGKKYFTKDGKVRKGYLDEYRQWLQDKRQAAEDAYNAQQDKLDHQLEMGYISEADYYTKLQKAYDKYKKDMSKEQKRQAKEDIRSAHIDAYNAQKDKYDSQLSRGVITQKEYYDNLVALGKDYYTKDGKRRQGYLEEWREWKEECINAQKAYVDEQKDLYNYQLERGIIDEEQLYNQTIALHNANPTNDLAEKRERRLEEDELWLNIYESKVEDLDDQLALGLITEEEYFNSLTELGETYLKDRQKYEDEYTDHLQAENDARQEAYDTAQEILDKQLENGEISIKEYNEQSAALVGKWLITDGLKDEAEDAGESIADNIKSGIEKEISDVGDIIEAKDLGEFDSWKDGESPIKFWDDMIDKLKEYYDLGLISEKEYHDYVTQCMEDRKAQYEEDQDQINTVIDLIENALRQEANDYIDSLNKQIDAYKEIIDAKKESLSLTQQELDYQDDLNNSANEITQLQSEIALLQHDDSRAGQAKLAEKQAELAEKQRERDKMVRDETVSKTEENLNKQSELFAELIQKEIDKTNAFLNNQAAVLEMVGKIIETVPEDELREWLIAYNGEHGDGMISTVDKAMGDLSDLVKEYGGNIYEIVEVLQKGIDVNVKGGIIKVADTDYKETIAEIDSKTHHTGLAAGFTGDGADLKQNEVWRKLTDDELVLNRADQLRLGQDMTILQSIKDAYSGMGASLAQSAGISSFPTTIEVSVSTPITIQGNATPEAVDRLEAMGDHIANTTLDKLANALQIKGISTSASSNMRKGN